MYCQVLVFVSGIVHVLGRPAGDSYNVNDWSSTWPLEKNVFLLPALLNPYDMINMTILITEDSTDDQIVVDFMGKDYNSKNAVISSIRADINDKISGRVTVYNENDKIVVNGQIGHFFLDDEKTLFNMWIKRIEDSNNDNKNILEVNTKSFAFEPFSLNYIDKIRYLKLSGDNVKMINLDFIFSNI